MRRHHALVILIVLLLVASAWMSYDRSRSVGARPRDAAMAPATPGDARPDAATGPERSPTEEARAANEARAKRDALREEIVRHVPSRRQTPDAAARGAAPTAKAAAPPSATSEPPAPALQNKMGPGRERLGAFLNDEFAPMLAECVEQAEARAPKRAGMYAIGIETLADEELGAVVDVADPAAHSEIVDPEFFECIRESAFTLVFPPPLTSGQEKFEITGYFGTPPPAEPALPGAPAKND